MFVFSGFVVFTSIYLYNWRLNVFSLFCIFEIQFFLKHSFNCSWNNRWWVFLWHVYRSILRNVIMGFQTCFMTLYITDGQQVSVSPPVCPSVSPSICLSIRGFYLKSLVILIDYLQLFSYIKPLVNVYV